MNEPMTRVHFLKTWPEYYEAVVTGAKPFEVRLNDRDFRVGDVLILQEYEPISGEYSGRQVEREVTYVLRDYAALQSGYVVLGIKP